MLAWHISNHADLSGQGGVIAAARWNLVDTPIVYCADHPASALLEMLVHVDAEDAPETFQLLRIEVPDQTPRFSPELESGWADDVAYTRRIGTDFITSTKTPVMEVPSAIVPYSKNYLLNPILAPDAGIRIVAATKHRIDQRLLGAP